MELLLEFFGELVLQVVLELVLEVVFTAQRAIGYGAVVFFALIGALLGAASLLVFKTPFIESQTFRLLNLVLSPVIGGCVLAIVAWRRRRDESDTVVPLVSFLGGAAFSLTFCSVRMFGL